MAGYAARVIDQAEHDGAAAVVFTLDTPGGLTDATREINLRILSARVPVVVYVAPDGARAGSAGVYITYAAHLAAMAPATNIGSATPVAMGEAGEQQLSPEMRAKVTNDAVASIRALAEQRGRDAAFAEQAVRDGANLEASQALQSNVVNFIARDMSDLLEQMNGARVQLPAGEVILNTIESPVQPEAMSPVEQFLLVITNPTIAYILLSLGSLGLILELYNPGSMVPGVVGTISLLLALYALGTLPVNYAALALLGLGLLLVALEPVIASHGVLALGGAAAFALGSLLLVNVPESASFLRVSPVAIGATTAVICALCVGALGALLTGRRRPVSTGREALMGATGFARTDIVPGQEGMVAVKGERWRAVPATATAIGAGTHVVVESLDGLVLGVRPLTVGPVPALQPVQARSGTARAA
jgi:membrane-bound serine protease (ClpP class)